MTLKEAEVLKGKKPSKPEQIILEQFGTDNRYEISLDDRGNIKASLKEIYR